MKKITAADPVAQSADLVADNVTRLMQLFPEACTEGKIDFDILLWTTILKQIAKQDSFDGHYANNILEVIRAFLKPLDDKTIISLWRKTETGMCDDTEDECLFPFCCRMELEMEILQQTTEMAWWEAEQLKPKSKRKKWHRREREDE